MTRAKRRLLFAVCFVAGLLTPFLPSSTWQVWPMRHEVQRIPSADKSVDAVSATIESGIFPRRLWYEVYLVKHGASFRGAKPVFSALKIENAELAWTTPRLLEINYARAHITKFKSYGGGSTEHPGAIEIGLIPSSATFSYLNSSGNLSHDPE